MLTNVRLEVERWTGTMEIKVPTETVVVASLRCRSVVFSKDRRPAVCATVTSARLSSELQLPTRRQHAEVQCSNESIVFRPMDIVSTLLCIHEVTAVLVPFCG